MEKEIQRFINEHVNCNNADIEVVKLTDDGTLLVALRGACSGCPGADETIEELLRGELMDKFKEIKEVEVEQQISEELLDFAKKLLSKDGK